MRPYREQVSSALDAVAIRSPSAYSWLGQVFERDPSRPQAARNRNGEPWIARPLHMRLYGDFYITGGPAPAAAAGTWRLDQQRAPAIDRLAAANEGRGSRQAGWVVRGRDGGEVVVERDGLALRARPEQMLGGERDPASGTQVALLMPSERLGSSEGFFTIFGDAGNGGETGPIDRYYWHLSGDAAPSLIAAASQVLNREGLPFRLKVVNSPDAERRCDTAVLYTRRDDRPVALALVAAIRRRVAPGMRDAVPALTLRLAPGLGFAEDPGGGESYGSHRCRLIAAAVIDAWVAGERLTGARLRRVQARFRAAGLDLGRPYLGSDSTDDPALTGLPG